MVARDQLVGRAAERAAIAGVLDLARSGFSGALLLRGPAGIGKSALLRDAVDRAVDFEVTEIVAAQTEVELGFAGLHRLLLPYLDRIDALPDDHRQALSATLGPVGGTPPTGSVLGLAVLALLAEVAEERPLLCVVDDAQWLDAETMSVLLLVARRLHADRIALIGAVRDEHAAPSPAAEPPELIVGALPPDDALSLVRTVARQPLDDAYTHEIVHQTGGSPLAIIELTRRAVRTSPGGTRPSPAAESGRTPPAAPFAEPTRTLSAGSSTFLLVAATDASGDPATVRAAAASLGAGPSEESDAVATGLLRIGAAVEFHHPLVRTNVYSGATPADRQAAHLALAEALGVDPSSADARAWHRAAAAAGPDESVADELVQAATRVAARGGHTTAGAFLERAASLTAGADRRAARVVAAGGSYLVGGAPARAQQLLAVALPHLADDRTRALGLRLLGTARYARGEAHGTTSVLLDAARALAPHDVPMARATLLDAQAASRVTGRYTLTGEGELDVGRVAGEIPVREGSEPTIADLLLDGNAALFAHGPEDAVALFREAHAAIDAAADDEPGLLTWLGIASWSAGALGDDQVLHRLSTRLVTLSRQQGAVVALSIGLMFRAMSEIFDGSLPDASRWFAERAHIMSVIDRTVDVGQLVVLAWSGDDKAARAEAERVSGYAAERRHGWMELFVGHALGALELGLGDYRAAFEISTKDYLANPFLSMVSFPNLIEAASRCGEMDAARAATAQLARHAELSGSALALGLLARCRALTTPGDEAGEHHLLSITFLERCRGDLQLARSRLVYGEWLRRRKRRVEAREQLRAAHTMLERMGAAAFAERAAVELAATGEHARRRSVDTLLQLTPQESHIAHLAAAGATNAEIAGRLYLSASTVTHHLQKVYRKLGLSSRHQLGAALASIGR